MSARATALVPATPSTHLPPLIAGAGDRTALPFLEFFTVNIRNKNTRAAYTRAAADFLRCCEGQGIGELGRVQPMHVAAYIELLQGRHSRPGAGTRPFHRDIGDSRQFQPDAHPDQVVANVR